MGGRDRISYRSADVFALRQKPDETCSSLCKVFKSWAVRSSYTAAPGEVRPQNFVTSLKWKLRTFIAGTTISNDSSPAARTGVPIISTFASISKML